MLRSRMTTVAGSRGEGVGGGGIRLFFVCLFFVVVVVVVVFFLLLLLFCLFVFCFVLFCFVFFLKNYSSSYFYSKHRFRVFVRTARRCGSNEYPQSMF